MAAEEAKKGEVEATKDIAEEKAVVPLPPPPAAAAKLADDDSKAIVAVVKGTYVTSYHPASLLLVHPNNPISVMSAALH